MNVLGVGRFIREQRRSVGMSVRNLAKLAGISNPYLSQIERGLRRPSAEILNGIAKALRISSETLFVKAGILDERGSTADVPSAIAADPGLTERQKQALVQIYESFRSQTAARRSKRTRRPSSADRLPQTGGRVETAG